MKFYQIVIKPVLGNCEAYIHTDPMEREYKDVGPHSAGFYYCPTSKSPQQGFEELRRLLISNYKKEVLKLESLIREIKALEVPVVITDTKTILK
jgi:hypothetical protein